MNIKMSVQTHQNAEKIKTKLPPIDITHVRAGALLEVRFHNAVKNNHGPVSVAGQQRLVNVFQLPVQQEINVANLLCI